MSNEADFLGSLLVPVLSRGVVWTSPKQRFGDFVPGQPCVLGHVSQDRIQRSNPKRIVERDRDVVLSVRIG